MFYTDENLKDMTLSEAQTEISNRIYEAAVLYELLESKHKVGGNGHHIRQKLSSYAMKLMEDSWIEKERKFKKQLIPPEIPGLIG